MLIRKDIMAIMLMFLLLFAAFFASVKEVDTEEVTKVLAVTRSYSSVTRPISSAEDLQGFYL